MDCSPLDSSVHGISQARILEWVAISFSRWSSQPRIKPSSPAELADGFFITEPPGKPIETQKTYTIMNRGKGGHLNGYIPLHIFQTWANLLVQNPFPKEHFL